MVLMQTEKGIYLNFIKGFDTSEIIPAYFKKSTTMHRKPNAKSYLDDNGFFHKYHGEYKVGNIPNTT